MSKKFKANEDFAQQVKLVDVEGNFLGVMSLNDALQKAKDIGKDLVEISSGTEPVLCKICDIAALITAERKKRKAIKKNAKSITVKELKVRPAITKHDLSIKTKHAIKFLEKKYHVVFIMYFRGREIIHVNQGKELLANVISELAPYSLSQERELKVVNNQIVIKFEPIK